MTHSTDALEREAEALRTRLADTAETLREKMTPGQLFDDYIRHSDGSAALHNLKTQARDNPLPLALVGAGLAWLFMGGGPSTGRLRSAAEGYASRKDERYIPDLWAGPRRNDGSGAMSKMSDAASKVSETAGSAYSAAGDMVSSASETVGEATSSAKRSVAHTAEMARERAAMLASKSTDAGRRAQKTFSNVLEQEPLVVGAIGIAVGAAIAAMLPRTRFEDEKLGPYSDQLREDLEETVTEGIEQAKDVAAETYHSAKDEAERQNLTSPSERPLAERVARVARSAAETAERSARSTTEPDVRK
jgi:hypothetical protein